MQCSHIFVTQDKERQCEDLDSAKRLANGFIVLFSAFTGRLSLNKSEPIDLLEEREIPIYALH
jgi:hypothetical protein